MRLSVPPRRSCVAIHARTLGVGTRECGRRNSHAASCRHATVVCIAIAIVMVAIAIAIAAAVTVACLFA